MMIILKTYNDFVQESKYTEPIFIEDEGWVIKTFPNKYDPIGGVSIITYPTKELAQKQADIYNKSIVAKISKKDITNEGYSNYNDLTTNVRDYIESKWIKIIEKSGKTSFTYYFNYVNKYLNSVDKKKIIIKFDPKAKYSFQKNIENGYQITINTEGNLEKSKNKIFATLTHELTHISQEFNKFRSHVFKEHRKKFKEIGGKWNEYYNDTHDKRNTEKEAVLIAFFELLRRKSSGVSHVYNNYTYFTLYPYKKIINKAILYGVDINTFNKFKEELKMFLLEKLNLANSYYDDSKWDVIKKVNTIANQFNLNLKNEINILYKSLRFDEPYINYDALKKEFDSFF
jgi:hypothetical protein